MPKGPLGRDLNFVTTNLKYDVTVVVDKDIHNNPTKAKSLLDMRVNAPQMDSNKFVKRAIGDVILAVNKLQHPSRTKHVNTSVKDGGMGAIYGDQSEVEIVHTYIVQGVGVGEGANTSISSLAAWKLHEVLINENDEHIRNAAAQREWNPSPYRVANVSISTQ